MSHVDFEKDECRSLEYKSRNTHVALSNSRNCHVSCQKSFKSDVTFYKGLKWPVSPCRF